MGMVGIEMTSFIAIIGAAGLEALSGTLQNFRRCHYFNIKTLKLGDFIDAQGYTGTVKDYHFLLC
jgi:small conductance mechanosensitive channel